MPGLSPTTRSPRVSRLDEVTVIWLRGEQDVLTVRVLADVLHTETATSDCDLVVDLDEVTYLDGASVAAIIRARELLQERGRLLILRAPSTAARRLLDVCGLTDLLAPHQPAPDG